MKTKPRMPRNTQMRLDIIHYMEDFSRRNARQPSIREIGAAVGLSSTSTIAGYLSRMVRDGQLGKVEGKYHNYYVISSVSGHGESA